MLEKRIGTAETESERALEENLLRIADWQGKTLTYRRVDAGYTNHNFLVHVADEDRIYFAKVVGENTDVFINRRVAHEAAVLAARCGVGPRIVHHDEETDFEVHEFLDGFRNFTLADMRDPDTAMRVMQAYAKIHAGAPLSATKTGFEQILEHAAQVAEARADTPPDLGMLLDGMHRTRNAIEAAGMRIVPCFNDCYVTNYMLNPHGEVRIIDWEYAAGNDPFWDLASYFFESFAPPDARRRLLRHYDAGCGAREEARVTLYIPLVCLKWGLWASLQASISAIEFDYLKYADLLFLRARYLMGQPEWEAALQSV